MAAFKIKNVCLPSNSAGAAFIEHLYSTQTINLRDFSYRLISRFRTKGLQFITFDPAWLLMREDT